LAEIIAQLIAIDRDGLNEWRILDLLHIKKKARAKSATSNVARHSESGTTLTARSVADDLNFTEDILVHTRVPEGVQSVRRPVLGDSEMTPHAIWILPGTGSHRLGFVRMSLWTHASLPQRGDAMAHVRRGAGHPLVDTPDYMGARCFSVHPPL
jgi:hypothetical protein